MNKIINCLMLKTPDDRRFFTASDHFPDLVKFAKVYKAEISVVKAPDFQVCDLTTLAKQLCECNETSEQTYELVEVKLPTIKFKSQRAIILEQANIISEYVKSTFLNGDIVELADLENKFKNFALSKAALCNHITKVKDILAAQGYKIRKLQRGKYMIQK